MRTSALFPRAASAILVAGVGSAALVGVLAAPGTIANAVVPAPLVASADADSLVKSTSPTSNYGSLTSLRVRSPDASSPVVYRSFVLFRFGDIAGPIASARLRLYVTDPSTGSLAVAAAIGPWSESSVTWSGAPAIGVTLARSGPVGPVGSWLEVALPVTMISGSSLALALSATSSDSAIFSSREGTHPPELALVMDPLSSPTASPGDSPSLPSPSPGPAAHDSMLIDSADLARLPTTGPAWAALKQAADIDPGPARISDQDSNHDTHTLAAALVFARTGVTTYRDKVLAGLRAAVGTEAGGRTLAEARNLPSYVIAADLIDLGTVDGTFDRDTFRPWLRTVVSEPMTEGVNLIWTDEHRPNNWGTHAGAARVAIAAYLGDVAGLARAAAVFHGWLGDRSSYAAFEWGDLSWQCDPGAPVGVDPLGCRRNGIAIDGALPDDMRRGGDLRWPPAPTGYAWEALQGATLEAELLTRAGYPAWQWQDRALLRAARFLVDQAGWPATGDDAWQPWLIDHAYGTNLASISPTTTGKNFGFADWLYAP